jgi:hypothetical protein
VPQIAGEYQVTVTLRDEEILGSPFTATVYPGEVKPSLSTTTIDSAEIAAIEAGITYFFTLQAVDIYGTLHYQSNPDLDISILVVYENHDSWPSPIGIADATDWQATYGTDIAGIAIDSGDGSYACQVTLYRSGQFYIEVKISSIHVSGSPYSPLLVRPTNIYAPYCVPLGISETMVAGDQYSFRIQGRDFYQNNIQDLKDDAFGTDFLVQYSLLESEDDVDFQPVVVEATLVDDTSLGAGVYKSTVTLTIAGQYEILVLLRGLQMPTDVETITVEPAVSTSSTFSNFTGVEMQYQTGQSVEVTIYARDRYGNLRTDSTADNFELSLLG